METKRVILAIFVNLDVTPTNALPWQPCVRFSKKFSFCLNFTFSTIFLINNGHRAIKVHVNKVQYCRAGHYDLYHLVSLILVFLKVIRMNIWNVI